ncbi:MAG: AarF/ABC1/UbiB kinase family protein [Candidatus Nanoarchaeia archaeon]|nr:AarF/ABC1/UbiB kinase family protein [Candidatus Nanoarchaeia archaeon]
MGLIKTIRDVKRLKNIANVLFSYELGNLVHNLGLSSHIPFTKRLSKEQFIDKSDFVAYRLRQSMEELSGAFVKLGQLLSLRPDLIPKEYCEEFSKLQDHVAPFSFVSVKKIVEEELKKPLEMAFSSFDKDPIASASIGQVHKAKLISGETVAVKVQRPFIDEIFETDMDLLFHIAHLAEKNMPELRQYDLNAIVKEFEDYTKKELNYIVEAKNIEEFYNNFKKDNNVKIPKIFWNFTTKKVLVMEFIEGEKIKEIKKLTPTKKKKIVDLITKSVIKQILEYHLFHADPHPGNLLMLKDDKIAFLDFGIVGRLSDDLIEKIEGVMIGLILPDKELLSRSLIELGFVKEEIYIDEFKEDLSHYLGQYYGVNETKIDLTSAMYDLISLSRKYKMKLPTNFVLLVKSLATLEGLVRELDPEYNLVESFKPYVQKLAKKRKSAKYGLKKLKSTAEDFTYTIKELPKDMRDALKNIKQGNLKLNIDNKDIRRFTLEIDRSSNRITYGLIIAALLVSGALVIMADLPPFYEDIPMLGIVFFLLAVVFIFIFVISIIIEKIRGRKNEED